MKEPLRTRYVPGYDLFKLIVAVILTIILILLLLREGGGNGRGGGASSLPTETDSPTLAATPIAGDTSTLQGTEIVASSTPTPDSTSTTAARVTDLPPTESPTPLPPAPTQNPTPEPASTVEADACPSNPTRIEVGDTVKVLDWLNFRIGPGLNYPIQRTNRPGTELEVIGGPVCTVKGGDPPRAYLWWNVRAQDDREGWSAEAPLNFPNYFLEPVR